VKQVGRYQILEELGRGAMGVVYQALDPAIGRTVAIKTIRLGELPDPEERTRVRDRLLREAQSAGILSHPNIVTIYDVLQEPDFAYVVMEYVAGMSLETMLRGRALPDRAMLLRFLRQVSDALDYAHHKGIVHRDIKPANIIVAEPAPGFEPLAKVTDFGVAKFVSHEVTHSGTMIGTPNYMSPEQIQGLTVDGRSDQFSLAVMVYELLSGEKPFEAENLPGLFYQICRQEPRAIEQVNPTIGETVGKVLNRGLAKEPGDRFACCGDFLGALSIALGDSPEWTAAPVALAGAAAAAGAASISRNRPSSLAAPVPRAAAAGVGSVESGTNRGIEPAWAGRPVQELPSLPRRRRDGEDEPQERRSRAAGIILLAAICAALAGLIVFAFEWKPAHGPAVQTPDTASGPVTPPPPAETLTPAKQPPSAPAQAPENKTAQNSSPGTTALEQVPPVAKHAETPMASAPAANIPPPQNDVAAVDLLSEPPGAKIVVDDNPQTSCSSPCTLSLTNGRHTLAVQMNGYETARRIFNVPDERSLYIPLTKSTGMLVVTSSPPGSSIFIDGQNYGHTPATVKVAPGQHTVELVNGPLRQKQIIEVESGAFIPVSIRWGRQ
jgi:serine/threonine-protein kinase